MDINRLGVEACLGYFIASSFSYGLKLLVMIYQPEYLIVLIIRALLMIGILVFVAGYKKGNFAEMMMLAALVIVGLGA